MKKPYLKKIGVYSGFTAWIMDGKYIRDRIDCEFTNYAQHLNFSFIPKKELWLDREVAGGEEQYYIDSMLTINRLVGEGKSWRRAMNRADLSEKRERHKAELLDGRVHHGLTGRALVEKIHLKLLDIYSDKIKVWLVDGERVRSDLCLDFTEGGHDLVYGFIPRGEIWLDNDISPRERKFILLHEMHERNLMARGWCYDLSDHRDCVLGNNGRVKKSAHRSASEIELKCRRRPSLLDHYSRAEIKKQIL